uniref:Uncharacterized protein n=1 Tax=Tetranychus urticae TaxID=32264 RepID=T1KDX1_TETUR
MAPKKNKQFYAYYFSTKDGPENRNKKYHIDSLEDITLYDGDQPLKLARIQVRNKPWTVKSDDTNERWNLCYTCKNITREPSVVEFHEKSPLALLPAGIEINVTDSTIGTTTFLEHIVEKLPDQQPSMLQREKVSSENQSSATPNIVPDEADHAESSMQMIPQYSLRIRQLTLAPQKLVPMFFNQSHQLAQPKKLLLIRFHKVSVR